MCAGEVGTGVHGTSHGVVLGLRAEESGMGTREAVGRGRGCAGRGRDGRALRLWGVSGLRAP